MKQTFGFLALLFVTLLSCTNKPGVSTVAQDGKDTIKSAVNRNIGSACYTGTVGNDLFRLKVDVYENIVTGDLEYFYSGKEKQSGIFQGRFQGDTLLADYTYESAGKNASRPIAFLIGDETAVEGQGDVVEINGRKAFKSIQGLQFGKGLNLNKTACPN